MQSVLACYPRFRSSVPIVGKSLFLVGTKTPQERNESWLRAASFKFAWACGYLCCPASSFRERRKKRSETVEKMRNALLVDAFSRPGQLLRLKYHEFCISQRRRRSGKRKGCSTQFPLFWLFVTSNRKIYFCAENWDNYRVTVCLLTARTEFQNHTINFASPFTAIREKVSIKTLNRVLE